MRNIVVDEQHHEVEQQAEQVNPEQVARFGWLQFTLLIRLSLSCSFLLYHRQNLDYNMKRGIAFAFLIYYLYRIGLQNYILKLVSRRRNNNNEDAENNNMNINENVVNSYIGYFYDCLQEGVKIPTSPGLFYDAASILISFLCSFNPTWSM